MSFRGYIKSLFILTLTTMSASIIAQSAEQFISDAKMIEIQDRVSNMSVTQLQAQMNMLQEEEGMLEEQEEYSKPI